MTTLRWTKNGWLAWQQALYTFLHRGYRHDMKIDRASCTLQHFAVRGAERIPLDPDWPTYPTEETANG